MIEENKTIFSSVPDATLKKSLFRGLRYSFTGILLILFLALFFNFHRHPTFTGFLCGLGFMLIGMGLVPYKGLKKLQESPSTIRLLDHEKILITQEKVIFKISFNEIKKIRFIKDQHISKIEVISLNNNENLIFPCFSFRSFIELKSWFDEYKKIKTCP